ncbi:MAG: NAD(P)/FAD-dependent oxidoreductase [Sandaracinaceae bacterium]|nr:NAD(P)/FAD-dependent oxidoreductase [Sandaracinaceae bacterium]
MTEQYDVAVIGGGPSGSTAAHLLAEGGAKVLVIEREVFPRFHIGESLLPASMEVFERLGFDPCTKDHVRKAGAQFFDEPKGLAATYLFSDSLGGAAHAYQVDRAAFDLALIEGAERAGATVHQGERVTDVELDEHGRPPIVKTTKGRYEARYVLDATGLDSFFGYANGSRRRIDAFGLGAIFAHYADLKPEIATELAVTGNVKIMFLDDGWIWAIPLGEGRLSVGLVTRRKGLQTHWLDEAMAQSPEMRRILEGATQVGPHHRLASFSFFNDQSYGPRWSCIGDAACFLDPVFSSGVTFAMLGAARAADRLVPALAGGHEGGAELMSEHAAEMKHAYDVFATIILAFYRRRVLPDLFFTSEQSSVLRKGMTSILAGDVWRGDNDFLDMLWRSRMRVQLERGV